MITITETNSTGSTVYQLSQANPTGLAAVATTGKYSDLIGLPVIPAAQKNANWTATAGVTAILNKPNLATVATSGSYNDLTNKPNIPVYQTLATVATTGKYSDLSGLPTIPVLPTLATVASSGDYNDLNHLPTIPVLPTLATVATTGKYSDLSGLPTIPVLPALATVATSGSYNDLTNKPTIPVLPTLATVATTGKYSDLSGLPTIPVLPALATVATTGKYSDLSGAPVIPAAQINVSWTATTGVAAILNKPTTLAGYGITDAVVSSLTPRNIKTSSYILTLADRDTQVDMNTTSAATVTIPLNSKVPFLTNTQLLVGQYGSGTVTIVGEAGVTIRSSGGKKMIYDQYSLISLKKLSTDEWLIVGNLK